MQPTIYLYIVKHEWILEGGLILLDQFSAPSYTEELHYTTSTLSYILAKTNHWI